MFDFFSNHISDSIVIISNFITIVSIFITVKSIQKKKKNERRLKTINWDELVIAMNKLCKRMKKDKFLPDVIIAPSARGAILAELLLQSLSHSREIPVYTGISLIYEKPKKVDISGYTKINNLKNWDIFIPNIAFKVENSKKILIVDDFTIAGTFPEKLKDLFSTKGFDKKNVKTMYTIITDATKNSNREPDYYYKIINTSEYYFPWGEASTG